jgi:hypothetical protein
MVFSFFGEFLFESGEKASAFYHQTEFMFYNYFMTESLIIDKAHSRRFVLSHLGLYPPKQLRGKQGVLANQA